MGQWTRNPLGFSRLLKGLKLWFINSRSFIGTVTKWFLLEGLLQNVKKNANNVL